MNILSLVFSILLILSFGYYAIWDKHVLGRYLQKTYTSHSQAERELLNQFASEVYNGIGAVKNDSSTEKAPSEKKNPSPRNEEEEPDSKCNRECARLNLWPLIHEGKENHLQLYDLAAKLIRTFYGSFCKEKRFEHRFLDALLISARKTDPFSLEKIAFGEPGMQEIYYKMLKGTKRWDLQEGIGYPPLLEYVKVEPSADQICVFHAHPDMLTVLFNPKVAVKLHQEIHKKEGAPLTKELIERLFFESYSLSFDPEICNLIALTGYLQHKEAKKIFIAKEGDVQIKKNFSLKK